MKLSNKLNHKSRKKTKKKYGGGNESFYYGASNILSKYANIEPKNHISMNHGIPEIALSNVNLIEKFTGPIRKSFKNPIIASWCEDYLINGEVKDYCNKYTTENYSIEEKKLKKDQYYDYCNEKLKRASSKTYTNNDIIGHPVIYMDINFNKKPKYKNGLLVFYNHTYEKSTFGNNEEVLHKNYIKKLDKLKKKFHPIHICLYWKDFDNTNLTNLLKNNKYYYFTNGHRDNNDNFLDNLVNNIQNYNYITSSLIGTHTWVALYLKKYFFLYGNGEPCSQESKIGHYDMWALRKCKKMSKYYSRVYPMLTYNYFTNFKDNSDYKKKIKTLGDLKMGLKYKKNKKYIKNLMNA